MMKNKGFTLVELLAVIVILAIIMIIAIPAVLDTMTSARRKTFGEYVTKVYTTAQNKYMEDLLLNGGGEYKVYNIKTDLGLSNTGDYEGYVAFINQDDNINVYISLLDNEYQTATKLGTDDSSIVDYINYTIGGEPTFTSSLMKFDGINNNFILKRTSNSLSNNDEINIPTSISDLVPISGAITDEGEFINQIKDMQLKALAKFKEDKKNHVTDNFYYATWKLDDDPNYEYDDTIAIYTYDGIYGNNDKREGYVIIEEIDYKNNIDIPDYISYRIAYRNEKFHTGLKRAHYTGDSKGNIITVEKIDYIFTSYSINGNNDIFNLTKIDNYDNIIDFASSWDEYERINGPIDYDNMSDVDYEKLMIQIDAPFYNEHQYFISNSVNDGLTMNKYNPSYYIKYDNAYYRDKFPQYVNS